MWKIICVSTIKWNRKLLNIIIKIDMMKDNNIELKENDRIYKIRMIDWDKENIPEPVSLLSTRWYSPASLVARSRGLYRFPTTQLFRTMHTIDVTLNNPAWKVISAIIV